MYCSICQCLFVPLYQHMKCINYQFISAILPQSNFSALKMLKAVFIVFIWWHTTDSNKTHILNKNILPRNSWDSKWGLSLNAEQVTTRQVLSPFTISLQLPSVSGIRWPGIKHTQTTMGVTAYCLPITFRIDSYMNDSFKWHPKNLSKKSNSY